MNYSCYSLYKYLLILYIITLSNCSKYDSYNYYDFAMKKCNMNDDWSIHGLWPQYTPNKWPQYCNISKNKEFNKKELSPIQNLLDKYWYSCYGQSYTFWEHEWDKHGECTNYTVLEYFQEGLKIFNNVMINHLSCCNETSLSCMISYSLDLDFIECKL